VDSPSGHERVLAEQGGVLASRRSATVQALDALAKQQRASADTIKQWAKSVAVEAEFQGQLLDKIEALYAGIEDGIRAQAPASSQGVGGVLADPVLDELQDLGISRPDPDRGHVNGGLVHEVSLKPADRYGLTLFPRSRTSSSLRAR
jgi:hypothetical protein